VATAQRNRIERYFDGLLGTPAERRATVGDD
jgi:hypothetical protein